MKTIIIICLITISPILCDQDQEQFDYYDADEYIDAPVLRPSEFTIEELVNPNFSINPESTMTFNYDKVINGLSSQPVEKRKESVQHYFRVRKPAPKRVIFHIKRSKDSEDNVSTPLYDIANTEKEAKSADLYVAPQELPSLTIYEDQHDDATNKIMPKNEHEENKNEVKESNQITTEISNSKNYNDEEPPQKNLTTDKQDAVPNISPTSPVDSHVEIQSRMPRLRIRSRQNLRNNERTRTTEKPMQTASPTASQIKDILPMSSKHNDGAKTQDLKSTSHNVFVSSLKRSQGRKWLHSTASPIITTENIKSTTPTTTTTENKLPVSLMRFRMRQKWPASRKVSTQTPPPLIAKPESIKDDTDKENNIETNVSNSDNSNILNNESLQSSSTKNQEESTTTTTLPPGSYHNSRNMAQTQNKRRILRRKSQKVTSPPVTSNLPADQNSIITTTELDSLSQTTNPQNVSSEEKPVSQKTESATELTTKQSAKTRRNFRRKWLHPQASTNKPEVSTLSPSVDGAHDAPVMENETKSSRRRFRNRSRKIRVDDAVEVKEITTTTTIIPSSAQPSWESDSTERNVSEENFKNTSESSESSLEEMSKNRFSKDNPPPPVPTLTPWYDGYGK